MEENMKQVEELKIIVVLEEAIHNEYEESRVEVPQEAEKIKSL